MFSFLFRNMLSIFPVGRISPQKHTPFPAYPARRVTASQEWPLYYFFNINKHCKFTQDLLVVSYNADITRVCHTEWVVLQVR